MRINERSAKFNCGERVEMNGIRDAFINLEDSFFRFCTLQLVKFSHIIYVCIGGIVYGTDELQTFMLFTNL